MNSLIFRETIETRKTEASTGLYEKTETLTEHSKPERLTEGYRTTAPEDTALIDDRDAKSTVFVKGKVKKQGIICIISKLSLKTFQES